MRRVQTIGSVVLLALSLAACGGMPDDLRLTNAIEPPVYGSLPSEKLLDKGKEHYQNGDYGLAELAFRKAVEEDRNNSEAWLGLAASYDRLRRFDLAERAYRVLTRLAGRTPVVLNNLGYHFMLRGDYAKARRMLAAARQAEPDNPFVQNNLTLLGEAETGKTYRPAGG
jgi:Flp pilus assembly protein TadD